MLHSRLRRPAAAPLGAAAVTLLLLLVPAFALGATISGAKVAKDLKARLTAQQGTRATSVSCPKTVNVVVGGRFRCQATFASGDHSPVKVRFKTSGGTYSYALQNLLVRKLEKTLAKAAASGGIPDADVTCPHVRVVEKGDEFICNAVGRSGDGGTFTVHQLGGGKVRYSLAG